VAKNSLSGNYQLNFEEGFPDQIVVYNYPYPNSINAVHSQAGFITGKWVIKRLSLNLGVRAERYDASYPSQDGVAGQFVDLFPVQHYQGAQILTWRDVVPHFGAAWDIRGNRKTVIQGSFGIFGDTMGSLFASTFNPDAPRARPSPGTDNASQSPRMHQSSTTAM
jgi:hypothetical protein